MTTANECARLARDLVSAIQSGALDEIETFYAPDSEVVNMATGERSLGPDGARRDSARWLRAFPDLRFDVLNVVAGEDAAVLELRVNATHTGPLVLPEATIEPTNRRMKQAVCFVLTFRDGLIVSEHDYVDMASMQQQLGLRPTPDIEVTGAPAS